MRKLWGVLMRRAVVVGSLVAVVALLISVAVDAPLRGVGAQQGDAVHWGGVLIVVDAQAPTSIYAVGIPRRGDVDAVGDSIQIVSWPAERGRPDPAFARVAGRVVWSVIDRPDATRWNAVNDTLGWLVLLEPSAPGDPHTLRAELRPEHLRPTIRSEQ